MKAIVLALFLSVRMVCADATNIAVLIAGRLHTAADIKQLVITHASRTHMHFDFSGVQPDFIVHSNGEVAVSMLCAKTNGASFYAAIDSKGGVSAEELTVRDSQIIRALVAGKTANVVEQVWLGPDGRVGATTVGSDKVGFGSNGVECEIFWLKRIRGRWVIVERGTLVTAHPRLYLLLAREIDSG